jgi:hypothetical protein
MLVVACGTVATKPHITGSIEDFKTFYGAPVSTSMQVNGYDTGYTFKDDGKTVIVLVKNDIVMVVGMDVGDGITDSNLLVYMPSENITPKPFMNANGDTAYYYTPSDATGTIGEFTLIRSGDYIMLGYTPYAVN